MVRSTRANPGPGPFFSPYKSAEFLYENHKFNNLAEKESEKIWELSCVTEMEWEMGSGL